MSHDIAFLHTADVHVRTFDGLMADAAPDLRVRHGVRPEPLTSAQTAGMTSLLEGRVIVAMRD